MQSATEMHHVALEIGAGRGVAHSCSCSPPRLSDISIADALVIVVCYLSKH